MNLKLIHEYFLKNMKNFLNREENLNSKLFWKNKTKNKKRKKETGGKKKKEKAEKIRRELKGSAHWGAGCTARASHAAMGGV
jgi:hypothetical protein